MEGGGMTEKIGLSCSRGLGRRRRRRLVRRSEKKNVQKEKEKTDGLYGVW